MLTRRDWLRTSAAAGAALTLNPDILRALSRQEMMTRTIPGTDEQLPIVGLGSSATFSRVARGDDTSALAEVLRALIDNGGTVFDTAPSYGSSEEVAGRLATELGITDRIFWATKVNVARRGGGADPAAARAQIERSFEYFGVAEMELMQVHNLGDMPVQMPIIEELKAEGRIRYIGTTLTPRGPQYGGLMQAMRDYPLDFIGVDYAVDNTDAADEVLPLAQELGIGVLVQRLRRQQLGAVLHQVRCGASGGNVRDPGHQQGRAHDRQPGRGPRASARRGRAAADDRVRGRAAAGWMTRARQAG